MHLGYLGPAPCFWFLTAVVPPAHSPQLQGLDCRHCSPFEHTWGSDIHIWSPKSPMAVTSLFTDMAGNTPFHILRVFQIQKRREKWIVH